jgi:hypothetical protein
MAVLLGTDASGTVRGALARMFTTSLHLVLPPIASGEELPGPVTEDSEGKPGSERLEDPEFVGRGRSSPRGDRRGTGRGGLIWNVSLAERNVSLLYRSVGSARADEQADCNGCGGPLRC